MSETAVQSEVTKVDQTRQYHDMKTLRGVDLNSMHLHVAANGNGYVRIYEGNHTVDIEEVPGTALTCIAAYKVGNTRSLDIGYYNAGGKKRFSHLTLF